MHHFRMVVLHKVSFYFPLLPLCPSHMYLAAKSKTLSYVEVILYFNKQNRLIVEAIGFY